MSTLETRCRVKTFLLRRGLAGRLAGSARVHGCVCVCVCVPLSETQADRQVVELRRVFVVEFKRSVVSQVVLRILKDGLVVR